MPRSSGARPRQAQREEVARLREALSECHSHQWQRAAYLFQEICRLCEHKGSRGGCGTPYPRSCRHCKRYGHSSQFCPALREREARELAREKAAVAHTVLMPAPWLRRFEAINAARQVARDEGLEGCELYWGEGGPCGVCGGCVAWLTTQSRAIRASTCASPDPRGAHGPSPDATRSA